MGTFEERWDRLAFPRSVVRFLRKVDIDPSIILSKVEHGIEATVIFDL
ncbi:hypothetical protein HFA01_00030 [Halobacillus faecis]|uniref:Uncharacterized protein n=1 Tax=Halobacillus faecis TaxID=360184 RepID=A0A511WMH5_9BACI|nr:hypothetical protein HFA01_00030 [Halobacillus faecis]